MASEKKDAWFGDEAPQCALCEHGKWNADHTAILCRSKGFVAPDRSCHRFCYDPLQREPKKQLALPQYSPEDFQL